MAHINLTDEKLAFLKDLIGLWAGPGRYRVERIAEEAAFSDAEPPPVSPMPRHRIYRAPILAALSKKGGQAHVAELKPLILEAVRPILTDRELNSSKSARPFWWFDCQVERYDLVREGLIEDNTSVGYWRLSPLGREAAAISAPNRL